MSNPSTSAVTLVDLAPQWVVLRVSGADADTFLQGQLCNDLRRLTPTLGQITGYSSAKGRMLAVMTLIRDGVDVEMELPRTLSEAISKRLRMFVLRSKVQIQESANGLIGLIGAGAAQSLRQAGLDVPEQPMETRVSGPWRVVRRFGNQPRFSIHGPAEQLPALRAQWQHASQAGPAAWAVADIEAGVPVVVPDTQDHFVAQMANLDLLGGISFDKGCYTGQEIVARLHYLGQLKRRMFRCEGSGAPPDPGTAVHAGDESQAVGEVVQAQRREKGCVASVVLQTGHSQSLALHAADTIFGLPQPYDYARPGGSGPS